MPFLLDEAFDYNDALFQWRALARNFPQKVKTTPTDPADTGVVIDNTVGGAAVGDGVLYAAPANERAALGTVILTAVIAGGDAIDSDIRGVLSGATTIDLNDTGNYIEDNNGASSTNFGTTPYNVVPGDYVKVNGANDTDNDVKWNGYYRVVSLASNGGGTNNRINLTAADIVGTPGDHSAQSGITITVIAGAGNAAFTVSGTAGVSGLLVAGQRFMRDQYSLIVRTITNWSITTNPDRITTTFGDGGFTQQYLVDPATVDFDTTGDTITVAGVNFLDLGFRVGAAVFVRNATDSGNDGPAIITLIDNDGGTNNRLTVDKNLTTNATDATAQLLPMNVTEAEVGVGIAFLTGGIMRRTDNASWKQNGVQEGDYVYVQNAADGPNNGFFRVDIIQTPNIVGALDSEFVSNGTTFTVNASDTPTVQGLFIPERLGEHKIAFANDNNEVTTRDAPTFITGEEMPLEDAQTNFNTQWHWEGPGKIFGVGVELRIFGQIRSFFDQGAGEFNWHMRGADGYVNSSSFSGQPNVSQSIYVLLSASNMPILITANGQRLSGRCRVGAGVDAPIYQGFGNLLGVTGQHPYPFICGGTCRYPDRNSSDVTEAHRAYYDPADETNVSPLGQGVFQFVDGLWGTILHSASPSGYLPNSFNQSLWWNPFVNDSNEALGDNTPRSWLQISARLVTAFGTEYITYPIELLSDTPQRASYIALDGVRFLSGESLATDDTFLKDGNTWLVTQNIFRTDRRSFVGMEMI